MHKVKFNLIVLLLIAFLASIPAFFLWSWVANSRRHKIYSQSFEAIQIGDEESKIYKYFDSEPKVHKTVRVNNSDCDSQRQILTKQIDYKLKLWPYPVIWRFGIDQNGRVMTKAIID